MVRLEGIWWESKLQVWGVEETWPEVRPVPADALRTALAECSRDVLLASAAAEVNLSLWVPVSPGGAGECSFHLREVPTLVFGAADAMDLLAGLSAPRPSGYGDSLRYWALLAKYAAALVCAQQFVPDIEEYEDGSFSAVWRPFTESRAELAWLERVAAAMPLVCNAVDFDVSAFRRFDVSPLQLIEDFLGATVDAVIRRTVADDPFFQRIHERARGEAPGEVSWLSALLGTERTIRGSREENLLLADRIRTWVGRLNEGGAAEPLRLCFTLVEPEDEGEVAGTSEAVEQAGGSEAGEANPESETPGPSKATRLLRPWRVELHLQTGSDEAGRLDLAEVWAAHGGRPTLLGRHLGYRRDQLLAELARARQVFPPLEDLPTNAPPTKLTLTTVEAYAFIKEWGPLLAARGLGVRVPEWAVRSERRLGLRLFVKPAGDADNGVQGRHPSGGGGGAMGLGRILDFDWRVAMGDTELSLAEFERLAQHATPLVQYAGVWLEIDADAADHALDFMRRHPPGRMSLRDALRVTYGAEEVDTGLPVLGLSGDVWIERFLLEMPETTLTPLPQPTPFRGTLRPYQRRGLDWLVFLDRCGIGACLADDMGLGKTIQLIALLLHEREEGGPVGPTLLFAPASVVGNWEREIERFTAPCHCSASRYVSSVGGTVPEPSARTVPGPRPELLGSPTAQLRTGPPARSWTVPPTLNTNASSATKQDDGSATGLRVLVHHGPERLGGDTWVRAAQQHDVVITTYALAHRDLEDLRRVRWHRIVLDEAQKIKNPQTNQTQAIHLLPADHWVALTGTPIENHLSDLWSIMEVLNPGLLGSAAEFRSRFVVPIEKLGDGVRGAQLRRMLQPFILRRTKSDPHVLCDLPEKMEMRVYCNLTLEQAALYQRIVDETMSVIDAAEGIRRRGLILAMLTRLKQACNHPCHLLGEPGPLDDRSGKCERLAEMLEEVLAEGDAALVFTQYREMGHLLERLLADRLHTETLFLHGGTPAKRRTEMVERFQDPQGGVRVFLLSLRAGGLGLNLTAANHVFHFDRWWNPAVEAQATDRAYRLGQTRCVQVHKFVCIGTVEERIDRMLEDKQTLAENVLRSGDEWLTRLSTNDLWETVRLSREAVG